MAGHYPITGIQPSDPKNLPRRPECNAWASDPNNAIQLSLYMRALLRWYKMPYNDPSDLSYYQIAGIHGYPADLDWNKAGKPSTVGAGFIYCNHNKVTFPTWHRPYMLLFEQRVHKLMLEVINNELNFTVASEKATWITAANQWRLPYFDWALPGARLPAIYGGKTNTISVRKPTASDGNTEIVVNPLYRFELSHSNPGPQATFGTLPAPYEFPSNLNWSKYYGTSRYGGSSGTGTNFYEGLNNWPNVNTALSNPLHWYGPSSGPKMPSNPLSDYVCRLLSYGRAWKDFASTQDMFDISKSPNPSWEAYLSLEYIHNNIHGWIGGNGGQMSQPAVAAFDPIFFMHHCNVDRQFAFWQTLHPGIWFAPTDTPTENDPLTPFFQDNINFFTSAKVRDWTAFGYEYDQLARQGNETDTQRRVRVAQWVKANYPSTGTFVAAPFNEAFLGPEPAPAPSQIPASINRTVIPNMTTTTTHDVAPISREIKTESSKKPAPAAPASDVMSSVKQQATRGLEQAHAVAPEPGQQVLAAVTPGGGSASDSRPKRRRDLYPDYLVNIIYDRYALQGAPYTLHFFLGPVTDVEVLSDDLTEHHDHYAGSVYTFTSKMLDNCDNCAEQRNAKHLSTAQIPITLALLRHAADPSVHTIHQIDHEVVENYLVNNLTWKAVDENNQIIPMTRLPRTRIFALKGRARHFHEEPERLSEYGGYTPMAAATSGKTCGADHAHYEDPAGGLM